MTRDDLARMSRDELIDLALADYAKLQALQAEVEALKMKLEKGKKPPTNSSNSSQPPSKDQKPNGPKDKRKRRHGPPVGHAKYERKMVAEPDHIVEVKPKYCDHCQADLSQVESRLKDVNQITELPEAKAEVIEVASLRWSVRAVVASKAVNRRKGWRWGGPLVVGWKQRWCTTGKSNT